VFGVTSAVTSAVGPVHDGPEPTGAMGHDASGATGADSGAGHGTSSDGAMADGHAAPAVGGLAVAEGDLRLVVDEPVRHTAQESSSASA
jgi:hypothetical protein